MEIAQLKHDPFMISQLIPSVHSSERTDSLVTSGKSYTDYLEELNVFVEGDSLLFERILGRVASEELPGLRSSKLRIRVAQFGENEGKFTTSTQLSHPHSLVYCLRQLSVPSILKHQYLQ